MIVEIGGPAGGGFCDGASNGGNYESTIRSNVAKLSWALAPAAS